MRRVGAPYGRDLTSAPEPATPLDPTFPMAADQSPNPPRAYRATVFLPQPPVPLRAGLPPGGLP